ncbi:MAG: hypothetical protein AABW87_00045 [Nanoarchaeota archaeon]
MGKAEDSVALTVGLLLVFFSLALNLNLDNIITGYSIKETTVTLDNLKEGVNLNKGSIRIIIPEELVGLKYYGVFASVSEELRYVYDSWKSNFKQDKRIYIPAASWWKNRISAYKSKNWFTDEIRSRELYINMQKDGVWLYLYQPTEPSPSGTS